MSKFKSKRIKVHYVSTEALRIVEEERIYLHTDMKQHKPKLISKNIISETKYKLSEITLNDLYEYRRSRKPGFVLKYQNHYFFTPIPKHSRLMSQTFKLEGFNISTATHLCGKNCRRLSAAQDCDGGCAKIRDMTFDSLFKFENLSLEKALQESGRIEKYDFISVGFEAFNAAHNCLFVVSCNRYIHKKVFPSQMSKILPNTVDVLEETE